MREFDKYIKAIASKEQQEIPFSAKNKVTQTLNSLPEQKKKSKAVIVLLRIAAIAASIVFVMLFLLPNISVAYAKTVGNIPVIGNIVQVITIRNYLYSDENHEMDIKVPEINGENSAGASEINKDIKELTNLLMAEFYNDLEEIGDNGHSAVYSDYELVTNTYDWFTLKISVFRSAGTGNVNYEYYHLNKRTGKTVILSDIVADSAFYGIVANDIKRQMKEKMASDSNLTYWVEDSGFGDDSVSINGEHNFYWDENGNLVIPFDKYEVAPGYMGTPEFTVSRDIIKDTLKSEIK